MSVMRTRGSWRGECSLFHFYDNFSPSSWTARWPRSNQSLEGKQPWGEVGRHKAGFLLQHDHGIPILQSTTLSSGAPKPFWSRSSWLQLPHPGGRLRIQLQSTSDHFFRPRDGDGWHCSCCFHLDSRGAGREIVHWRIWVARDTYGQKWHWL